MRKQKFSFLGENFGDPSPSGDAFDIHAFTQHTLSSSQIYHPFLYHLIIGVRTQDYVGFKESGKRSCKNVQIYLYKHIFTRKLYQIFIFLSFRFYILTGKCGFKIIYSHLSPFRAPRMKLSPFQEKHNCGNSAATEKFLKESRLATSLSSSPKSKLSFSSLSQSSLWM